MLNLFLYEIYCNKPKGEMEPIELVGKGCQWVGTGTKPRKGGFVGQND